MDQRDEEHNTVYCLTSPQYQSPQWPLYLMDNGEVQGVLEKLGRGETLRAFRVVTINNTPGNTSRI